MLINVKFYKEGAAETKKPLVKKFPATEFGINVLKEEINRNGYDKVVDVQIEFFPTYEIKYDWDFKEEIRQMFYEKNVDEIQKIVEQFGVITYFQMLDVLEKGMYEGKSHGKKYEDILQKLVMKLHEKDERGYLIPEELL